MASHDIRWARVFLGGIFIEMTMLAILIPVNFVSAEAAYYLVPVLALATAFLFGRWAAEAANSRFVLHGVLTAAVASTLYLGLTTISGAAVPLLYHISNGVRLLAGAVGGARARRRTVSAVPAS